MTIAKCAERHGRGGIKILSHRGFEFITNTDGNEKCTRDYENFSIPRK